MIVVDASALADALVDKGRRGIQARASLASDPAWVVPDHCRIETFSALRRWVLSGRLSETDGRRAVERLTAFTFEVVPVVELLPRMWSLRDELSGYDSAYVALAEVRELTLVTADAPLARAAVRFCRVELISGT